MTEKDPYVDEVKAKAERMAKARRDKGSFWSTLALAGSVGWQLALPLAVGAVGGHALARRFDDVRLALAGLLLGLVAGLLGGGRALRDAMKEAE